MRRSIYLNRQHFFAMLCVALAVHIVMGVAWALSPGLEVNKIPVHVLNIKLGAGDIMAMTSSGTVDESKVAQAVQAARQPEPVPPPHESAREKKETAVKKSENAVKDVATKQAAQKNPAAATERGKANAIRAYVPANSASDAPLSSSSKPSRYVRQQGDARGRGAGSALGNTLDSDALVMQRYTQLISMWINRQKAILNRAVQPGMRGNIVIRLRIDRNGKIHFFKLDKATGVPVVDSAAADMVRAANPVPPVPSNYPGGNMFEFLIPVGYTFQQ